MTNVGNKLDNLARCVLEEVRKEFERMTSHKRKITKEQFQKAQNGNWDGIFMEHEVQGYGVYGEQLHYDPDKNEYYVTFYLGETCD